MLARALSLLALLAAAPAAAHPHIFIDTTLEVIFDAEGRAEALRIGWRYDELFSLLLVEDGRHDADGDGAISAEELKGLDGFDMDWGTEFLGDLAVRLDGAALALTGPLEWTTGWEDGKLFSTHLRRFETPVEIGSGTLVLSPYDPGFYSAYTIVPPVTLTGRGDCAAGIGLPDMDAAYEELLSQLREFAPGEDPEEAGYPPDIGAEFAGEARITCGD